MSLCNFHFSMSQANDCFYDEFIFSFIRVPRQMHLEKMCGDFSSASLSRPCMRAFRLHPREEDLFSCYFLFVSHDICRHFVFSLSLSIVIHLENEQSTNKKNNTNKWNQVIKYSYEQMNRVKGCTAHTHTHTFDSLFSSRHASESFIIISTTVAAATTASATAVVAT